MEKEYVVISVKKGLQSKFDSSLYDALKLMDAEGNVFKTYVGHNYKNREWWEEIIESGRGTKVKNLLIKKDDLINADSKPEIIAKPYRKPDDGTTQVSLGDF